MEEMREREKEKKKNIRKEKTPLSSSMHILASPYFVFASLGTLFLHIYT